MENTPDKTRNVNHEFIHRIVTEDLQDPRNRERYEKQGLNAYEELYKLYSKPQPISMKWGGRPGGKVEYEVLDTEGNIMDLKDPDVQDFIQSMIEAESGLETSYKKNNNKKQKT